MDAEELTRLTERADWEPEAGDRRKWRLTWNRIAADATEEQWARFGARRAPGQRSARDSGRQQPR